MSSRINLGANSFASALAATIFVGTTVLSTATAAYATTLPTATNLDLGLAYAANEAQDYGMAPSPSTTSRYMSTTDSSVTYREGCAQGEAGEQGEIILDFGKPWFDGTNYGTVAFDGSPRSISDIEDAVINFAYGYFQCTGPHQTTVIGIGTNNCYWEPNCHNTTDYTGYAHGQAWHSMVNDVWNVISAEGWSSQVHVHGASDMELAWDSPANTLAWANGFNAGCCGQYYDYGDANGCPPFGNCYGVSTSQVTYQWTPEDLFQITWGIAAAFATPEVYGSGQVNEWEANAKYGVDHHNELMQYQASFTEWNASRRSSSTNSPDQGNAQLNHQLQGNTETKGMTVLDETDITWTN